MGSAWKVAYADFVTAMMAFFLLLWVLSMVPPETRAGLAAYFSGDRNFDSSSTSPVSNNPFIQNTDKIDTRDIKISEVEKSHYAIAQKIKQLLMADSVPQSASGISADDVGVQLRVNSDIMFKPGTVELLPEGDKVLSSVLSLMEEYNLYLVVRGHADSVEAAPPYASAWELSGARAAAMVNYLAQRGIKATRMRAVSYGDTRPLKPGIDEQSRAMNRRVEFFFHRPEVMSYSVVY
ncbi:MULTISPECIES: OmpA/MotB family protein [Desulfovibrio]|uniref:Chemotaxis protein MotB n=1 Tax=Desulfovibrio desulfuricans TaxID=876 RepID=A0AA94HR59_DESDE|nr:MULTISPECIES: flagellar motor protein MotB [Desulfovibrio]ATD80188.1 chemotaxis protein MotB [Desulfovibrio sp. G11]SFW25872.1 chemotaxis protein MotB [Desulfovibrio desulfuricans]SPD35650.1 MotA/MotB proton-channel complex, MotB [Desulfovibrio sp. G11]